MSKALDDAHDATIIRRGGNLGPGLSARIHVQRFAIVLRCPLMTKNGAAKGKLGGAVAVGHEAEVADAVEPVGQRMKKEAANELVGPELHDFCCAVLAIVLPGKGDMIVVESDDPAVGDRNAMGVAAEIGQDLCGVAEGSLGVDDPVDALHGSDATPEGIERGQRPKVTEERKAPTLKAADRRLRKSVRNSLNSGLTAKKKFHPQPS